MKQHKGAVQQLTLCGFMSAGIGPLWVHRGVGVVTVFV
jgi:hypothetical protein